MSSPQIVARFAKNTMEDVVVALDQFRNVDLVDVRVYASFDSPSGERRPTKKGISIKRELLGDMILALQAARDEIASPTGRAL